VNTYNYPRKILIVQKKKINKPDINKIKFTYKKLDPIDGSWLEIPQSGEMIAQYHENDNLVVKVENLHDFPIHFAVYEKKDGKYIKEYPKNSPTSLKTLTSIGNKDGNFVEITAGKCKLSNKLNLLENKELQSVVVEVTSSTDIEEMKTCSILIPLSIFVVANNDDTEDIFSTPIKIDPFTTTTTTTNNTNEDVNDLLKKLEAMGFTNRQKNEEVLIRNNKDIDKTISDLVSMYL